MMNGNVPNRLYTLHVSVTTRKESFLLMVLSALCPIYLNIYANSCVTNIDMRKENVSSSLYQNAMQRHNSMNIDSRNSNEPNILYISFRFIIYRHSTFISLSPLSCQILIKQFLYTFHVGIMTEYHYDVTLLNLGAS